MFKFANQLDRTEEAVETCEEATDALDVVSNRDLQMAGWI